MATEAHYIVTGGCGFVGSNLVAQLLKRRPGSRITIIDDFSSGNFANVISACDRACVPPFQGECLGSCYTTLKFSELLAKSTKAVFHLAAITDTTVMDQSRMLAVNTHGFEPLAAACLHAHIPLAYASSAATYGTPPETQQRKAFPISSAGRPNNIYGFSKWLMEGVHHKLTAAGTGTSSIVGLRYFNVFGPGESYKGKMASMVRQLVRQAIEGKTPRLFADGSQARDQVYVDDVVNATLAAAGIGAGTETTTPRSGVYNVGSGIATSFNDIVAAIRLVPELKNLNAEYFEMPASIREFYQDYTCADLSGNKEGLGWLPAWKPADAIAAYAHMLVKDRRL